MAQHNKYGRAPELNSTQRVSFARRPRRHLQNDVFASFDDADIKQFTSGAFENAHQLDSSTNRGGFESVLGTSFNVS